MTINKQRLRRLINEVLLNEEAPPKPGQEKTETEANISVNSLAGPLGLNNDLLRKAFANAKKGTRTANDNAILADFVVNLINAGPAESAKVLGTLKAISAKNA